MMNVLVSEIPFIEILLVFILLTLGSLGFYSLLRKRDLANPMKYVSTGKWILASLMGLALLAIILFLIISLVRV